MATELGNFNALMGALRRFFVPVTEDDEIDAFKHISPQLHTSGPNFYLSETFVANTPREFELDKHYAVRLASGPQYLSGAYISWRDISRTDVTNLGTLDCVLYVGDSQRISRGARKIFINVSQSGSYVFEFCRDRFSSFKQSSANRLMIASLVGGYVFPSEASPKAGSKFATIAGRTRLLSRTVGYAEDYALEYFDLSDRNTAGLWICNTTDKSRDIALWVNGAQSFLLETITVGASANAYRTFPSYGATPVPIPLSLGIASAKNGAAGSGNIYLTLE